MDIDQLIADGLSKKLIRFESDGKNNPRKYIFYVQQNKKRNFDNPEEQVQAEAYLRLTLIYKYPAARILHYVPVQMGSETKEADIIVFADDARKSPLIIVECKEQKIKELEFARASEQAFSYAIPQNAKYVWTTTGLKDEYFQVDLKKPRDRVIIPDIPQFGVKEIAPYKFARNGGTAPNGQQLFPLSKVAENDLTRRFELAHQALWGGGELNPSEAFDELDKLIFCKLWDERKPRHAGEAYDFQVFREASEEQTNRTLLERIKQLYEEGRKKDPEVFRDNIRLSAAKARTVVSYLEGIDLSETDLDSKGRAFETFLGSFFRGDFGQFFTPRAIVKFMVDVLPITHQSRVLDTSCGSGGFLLHALDKVRGQANAIFPNHKTAPKEILQHYNHWHDFASRNLFGIEINEQIARTAKMNMIIHDDGHTNVVAADGLLPDIDLRARTGNKGFAFGGFDIIITNPPFGSSVKLNERAYLNQYGFAARSLDWLNPRSLASERPSVDTEILFIEQCHNYLAAGGYLAIVVPDGILTNSSLQYVREEIEARFRLVAVVSFPGSAFVPTGAGVKSSVLFLKKLDADASRHIRNAKDSLKDDLSREHRLRETLDELDQERKRILKTREGLALPETLIGAGDKAIRESDEYKVWAKQVSEEFAERVELLRFGLSEMYEEQKRRDLPDYPIFMAIAEDIGYDAANRRTKTNELDFIAPELARFIEAIERGAA